MASILYLTATTAIVQVEGRRRHARPGPVAPDGARRRDDADRRHRFSAGSPTPLGGRAPIVLGGIVASDRRGVRRRGQPTVRRARAGCRRRGRTARVWLAGGQAQQPPRGPATPVPIRAAHPGCRGSPADADWARDGGRTRPLQQISEYTPTESRVVTAVETRRVPGRCQYPTELSPRPAGIHRARAASATTSSGRAALGRVPRCTAPTGGRDTRRPGGAAETPPCSAAARGRAPLPDA